MNEFNGELCTVTVLDGNDEIIDVDYDDDNGSDNTSLSNNNNCKSYDEIIVIESDEETSEGIVDEFSKSSKIIKHTEKDELPLNKSFEKTKTKKVDNINVDTYHTDAEEDTSVVKTCCIYNCNNLECGDPSKPVITLFNFPKKDRQICDKWVKFTTKVFEDHSMPAPTEFTSICSDHFEEKYLLSCVRKKDGQKFFKLKKGAVPFFVKKHSNRIPQPSKKSVNNKISTTTKIVKNSTGTISTSSAKDNASTSIKLRKRTQKPEIQQESTEQLKLPSKQQESKQDTTKLKKQKFVESPICVQKIEEIKTNTNSQNKKAIESNELSKLQQSKSLLTLDQSKITESIKLAKSKLQNSKSSLMVETLKLQQKEKLRPLKQENSQKSIKIFEQPKQQIKASQRNQSIQPTETTEIKKKLLQSIGQSEILQSNKNSLQTKTLEITKPIKISIQKSIESQESAQQIDDLEKPQKRIRKPTKKYEEMSKTSSNIIRSKSSPKLISDNYSKNKVKNSTESFKLENSEKTQTITRMSTRSNDMKEMKNHPEHTINLIESNKLEKEKLHEISKKSKSFQDLSNNHPVELIEPLKTEKSLKQLEDQKYVKKNQNSFEQSIKRQHFLEKSQQISKELIKEQINLEKFQKTSEKSVKEQINLEKDKINSEKPLKEQTKLEINKKSPEQLAEFEIICVPQVHPEKVNNSVISSKFNETEETVKQNTKSMVSGKYRELVESPTVKNSQTTKELIEPIVDDVTKKAQPKQINSSDSLQSLKSFRLRHSNPPSSNSLATKYNNNSSMTDFQMQFLKNIHEKYHININDDTTKSDSLVKDKSNSSPANNINTSIDKSSPMTYEEIIEPKTSSTIVNLPLIAFRPRNKTNDEQQHLAKSYVPEEMHSNETSLPTPPSSTAEAPEVPSPSTDSLENLQITKLNKIDSLKPQSQQPVTLLHLENDQKQQQKHQQSTSSFRKRPLINDTTKTMGDNDEDDTDDDSNDDDDDDDDEDFDSDDDEDDKDFSVDDDDDDEDYEQPSPKKKRYSKPRITENIVKYETKPKMIIKKPENNKNNNNNAHNKGKMNNKMQEYLENLDHHHHNHFQQQYRKNSAQCKEKDNTTSFSVLKSQVQSLKIDLNKGNRTIEKLKQENKQIALQQKEIISLKKRILDLQAASNNLREENRMLGQRIRSECFRDLKRSLTENQIYLLLNRPERIRWHLQEVLDAYRLKSLTSEQIYEYVKKELHCPLPSLEQLYGYLKTLKIDCIKEPQPQPLIMASTSSNRPDETTITKPFRLCSQTMNFLKIFSKKKADLNTVVVLSLEEYRLDSLEEFDEITDELLSVKPGTSVQILMAHGLYKNWKQPIYISYEKKINKTILMDHVIKNLNNLGFDVVALIASCKKFNLWKELHVTINKPYIENRNAKSMTTSNTTISERIYVFFDPSDSLRLLRYWYLEAGFILHNGTVITKELFSYLIENYPFEAEMIYGFTQAHFNNKEKCSKKFQKKLAKDLMSETAGNSLRDYASCEMDVCDFFYTVGQWYNLMCGIKNEYYERLSQQDQLLDRMYKTIKQMRHVTKTKPLNYQKAILITIQSLRFLQRDISTVYDMDIRIPVNKLNLNEVQKFYSDIKKTTQQKVLPLTVKDLKSGIQRVLLTPTYLNELKLPNNVRNQQQQQQMQSEYVSVIVLNEAHMVETPWLNNDLSDTFSNENQKQSDEDQKIFILPNIEYDFNSEEDGFIYLLGWIVKHFQRTIPKLSATHENAPSQLIENEIVRPSKWWIESAKILEDEFILYHKVGLRKTEVMRTLIKQAIEKYRNIPKEIIKCFIKQRTFIRLKLLRKKTYAKILQLREEKVRKYKEKELLRTQKKQQRILLQQQHQNIQDHSHSQLQNQLQEQQPQLQGPNSQAPPEVIYDSLDQDMAAIYQDVIYQTGGLIDGAAGFDGQIILHPDLGFSDGQQIILEQGLNPLGDPTTLNQQFIFSANSMSHSPITQQQQQQQQPLPPPQSQEQHQQQPDQSSRLASEAGAAMLSVEQELIAAAATASTSTTDNSFNSPVRVLPAFPVLSSSNSRTLPLLVNIKNRTITKR